MPNPPVPNELKRRRGNPGKRALTPTNKVVALPTAVGVPEPPEDLGLDGRRLWGRAWGEGLIWISPHSDMEAVEQACRLVDDLAIARERYRATHEPVDARSIAMLARELRTALGALGFDPTARTRLGVAEVKAATTLDELRNRQRQRDSRRPNGTREATNP